MQKPYTRLSMVAQTMFAQTSEVCAHLDTQLRRGLTGKDLIPESYVDPMAKAAQVLGCAAMPAKHFKALNRLSRQGFFRAGGALTGALAVHAYANAFGVRWSRGVAKNVGNVDTNACLVTAPGIEAKIPELQGKLKRREHEDYLAEGSDEALVISNGRFAQVNVVQPARYIIHTLAQPATTKAEIARAYAVLHVMIEQFPYRVKEAYHAFASRSSDCEHAVWRAMRVAEATEPTLYGSLEF